MKKWSAIRRDGGIKLPLQSVRRLPTLMPLASLVATVLALCLTGCSYTQVGDGMGTRSPDGKFSLAVGVDGARGHAYVDRTKKTIWIWIGSGNATNSTTLFERSYILTGAAIAWETQWSSPEAVSVKLYDWGDGVSNYRNSKGMTTSNHIALLSFALDRSTGKFTERK